LDHHDVPLSCLEGEILASFIPAPSVPDDGRVPGFDVETTTSAMQIATDAIGVQLGPLLLSMRTDVVNGAPQAPQDQISAWGP
jgi:hypothetical protein